MLVNTLLYIVGFIYIFPFWMLIFSPVLFLFQASNSFFLVSTFVALISRAALRGNRKNYNVRYYTVVYDFSTWPSF